jgi:hypothetical protein
MALKWIFNVYLVTLSTTIIIRRTAFARQPAESHIFDGVATVIAQYGLLVEIPSAQPKKFMLPVSLHCTALHDADFELTGPA